MVSDLSHTGYCFRHDSRYDHSALCIKLGGEITKNSYNAVKVSKMLSNRGMDADLETGLRLEIYGWALCFAHEDRQKMMSAFLNMGRSKKIVSLRKDIIL